MATPFNLREWPHFRVARNVVIVDDDDDDQPPPPRRVPTLPLGMSQADCQAQERDRALEIDAANDAAQRKLCHENAFFAELDNQIELEAAERAQLDEQAHAQQRLDDLFLMGEDPAFYDQFDQNDHIDQ